MIPGCMSDFIRHNEILQQTMDRLSLTKNNNKNPPDVVLLHALIAAVRITLDGRETEVKRTIALCVVTTLLHRNMHNLQGQHKCHIIFI